MPSNQISIPLDQYPSPLLRPTSSTTTTIGQSSTTQIGSFITPINTSSSAISPQKSSTSTARSPSPPSSISQSSRDFDISPYCVGTPHHIGNTSSGSISLLLSLQEHVIYLPAPQAVSPSSYREHDNGPPDLFSGNTPPVNDPLNENYSPPPSFTDTSTMMGPPNPNLNANILNNNISSSTSSTNTHHNNNNDHDNDHDNERDHHHHHNHNNNNPSSNSRSSRSRGWLRRRRRNSASSSSGSSCSSCSSENLTSTSTSNQNINRTSTSNTNNNHNNSSSLGNSDSNNTNNNHNSTQQQQQQPHLRKLPSKCTSNLLNSSLPIDSSSTDLPPAVLRGSLIVKLSKPTKLKNISLRFYGKSKTSWLESNYSKDYGATLPHGPEFQDEVFINSHTWEFVPSKPKAQSPSSIVNLDGLSIVSSDVYGADVAYIRPNPSPSTSSNLLARTVSNSSATSGTSANLPLSPTLTAVSTNSAITPAITATSSTGLKFKTPLAPSDSHTLDHIENTGPSHANGQSLGTNDSNNNNNSSNHHHHHHHHNHNHNHNHNHQNHNNNNNSTSGQPSTSSSSSSTSRNSVPQSLSLNHVPFFTPLYFDPQTTNSAETPQGLLSPSFNPVGDSATLYPAGEYVFHFTLAIDPRTSETIRCPNGTIRYYLEARVSRSSVFSFAVTGQREVTLVRSPPDTYDSTINTPISITRDWDNRLHYEIVCPKKYVPLGSSLPLSIKLTPLDKVQVHRIRVQVIEKVTYICAKTDVLQHIDPIRKVTLFQKKAKSEESSSTDAPTGSASASGSGSASTSTSAATPSGSTTGSATATNSSNYPAATSADPSTSSPIPISKHHSFPIASHIKNKRKSANITPGNLLNYIKGNSSSSSSNNNSNASGSGSNNNNSTTVGSSTDPFAPLTTTTTTDSYDELISTTTNINCSLPFVSPEDNWDSVAAHHFTNPSSDSKYFQFLRPDAIYNPFIHVKHRLHISFRISKKDPTDSKRRFFEVLIDTPIYFLSKHCKSESVELPLYDSVVHSRNDAQFQYHQQLLQQYQADMNQYHRNDPIDIPGRSSDFGSPLVRSISSETSNSPPYDGFSFLNLDPQSSTIQPPSFNEALSDPLLIEPTSPSTSPPESSNNNNNINNVNIINNSRRALSPDSSRGLNSSSTGLINEPQGIYDRNILSRRAHLSVSPSRSRSCSRSIQSSLFLDSDVSSTNGLSSIPGDHNEDQDDDNESINSDTGTIRSTPLSTNSNEDSAPQLSATRNFSENVDPIPANAHTAGPSITSSLSASSTFSSASLATTSSSINSVPETKPTTATPAVVSGTISPPPPNYADIMRETIPLLRKRSNSSFASANSGISFSSTGSGLSSNLQTTRAGGLTQSISSGSSSTAPPGIGIGMGVSRVLSTNPVHVTTNNNNLMMMSESANSSRIQLQQSAVPFRTESRSTSSSNNNSSRSRSTSTTRYGGSRIGGSYTGNNSYFNDDDEEYDDVSFQDNEPSQLKYYMESLEASRFGSPGI